MSRRSVEARYHQEITHIERNLESSRGLFFQKFRHSVCIDNFQTFCFWYKGAYDWQDFGPFLYASIVELAKGLKHVSKFFGGKYERQRERQRMSL